MAEFYAFRNPSLVLSCLVIFLLAYHRLILLGFEDAVMRVVNEDQGIVTKVVSGMQRLAIRI
jgi:hypothetical protein